MDLAVVGDEYARGIEENARVVQGVAVALAEGPAVQPDAVRAGKHAQCDRQRSVEGLGMIPRRGDVEGGDVPQLR